MADKNIDLKKLSNDPNCRGADGYSLDIAAGIMNEDEEKNKKKNK